MLVRFFRTREYAEQFIKGEIFFNSLSFFQSYITDVKGTKLALDKCSDILEGSMTLLQACFPFADLKDHLSSDPYIVFPEYSKCHICCFSNVQKGSYPKNMESFGRYCVAIYDYPKFAEHIKKSISKINGMYYLIGGVEYYKPTINKVFVKQKNHLLMSLEGYRILYNKNSDAFIYKDAFNKIDRFKEQKEWRLLLYKGNWNTKNFILNSGDLSDCCKLIHPDKNSFAQCIVQNHNSEAVTKIKGNINRINLNKKIIEKNPWGKIHFSLGDYTLIGKEMSKIVNHIPPNFIKETGEQKRAVIRLILGS